MGTVSVIVLLIAVLVTLVLSSVISILIALSIYKKKIENHFGIEVNSSDIGAVVINANPVTLGHVHLVETASKNHSYVIVFLLEEDLSFFSYKERMTLCYLAFLPYKNVLLVPSTNYIVSSLTFPGYFLKEETEKNKEWAKVDALIFKDHFMKILNVKMRYVGTETKGYMKVYNDTLKEVLEDKLTIIDRIDNISASTVRSLLKEGKVEEALQYTPQETGFILRGLASEKYGNKTNKKGRM